MYKNYSACILPQYKFMKKQTKTKAAFNPHAFLIINCVTKKNLSWSCEYLFTVCIAW